MNDRTRWTAAAALAGAAGASDGANDDAGSGAQGTFEHTSGVTEDSGGAATRFAPSAGAMPRANLDAPSALEVLWWWDPVRDACGITALLDAYRRLRPAAAVNPIYPGAAYRTVLDARTAAQRLPDAWQAMPGFDLLGENLAGQRSVPVDEVYETGSLAQMLPADMVNLVRLDDEYRIVPFDVHRTDILWYNVGVLAAAGIEPAALGGMDAFLTAVEQLKGSGAPPLCIADRQGLGLVQLFENVAVGVGGPPWYGRLWKGAIPADDPVLSAVTNAYDLLLAVGEQTGLAADDAADDAVAAFVAGRSAFLAAPDQAYNRLLDAGMQPGRDFASLAFPRAGDGYFMLSGSGFSLAGDKLGPAGLDWLRAAGSREAQEALAADGVSIGARTDCDSEGLNRYQRWVLDSYRHARLAPSYVHGAGAVPMAMPLREAALNYIADRNKEHFSTAFASDKPTRYWICCEMKWYFCC